MEMPNYLPYFEGHYMIVQPPILWKPMLPWWVQRVFGRDAAFARTLQTQINPLWIRRTVGKLRKLYPVELISLGEEVFLECLSQPFRSKQRRFAAGRAQWSGSCRLSIWGTGWGG